jgi:hypothetical protein
MHELTRQKFLSGPRPVVLADVFTERERTDPAFNYNFDGFGFTDQNPRQLRSNTTLVR